MADSGDVTGLGGQLWRLYSIEQQAERDCEEKLRIYREAIHTYKRETVDYSRAMLYALVHIGQRTTIPTVNIPDEIQRLKADLDIAILFLIFTMGRTKHISEEMIAIMSRMPDPPRPAEELRAQYQDHWRNKCVYVDGLIKKALMEDDWENDATFAQFVRERDDYRREVAMQMARAYMLLYQGWSTTAVKYFIGMNLGGLPLLLGQNVSYGMEQKEIESILIECYNRFPDY
ncbi:hypothetical protein G7054_g12787 [Neopestalotiopsis clavispora]|nr:hypothetical protein G7054_g12787 [Neopestalotiopsis clavispora]